MNLKKLYSFFVLFVMIGSTALAQNDWANLAKYADANEGVKSKKKNKQSVVFMGNSITERWEDFDSAFFQSNPYINRGISGQTTPQMLIRFRADVIELEPSVVVICAGTNDIAGNTGPMTLDQIAGNIISMTELARANGIKVVLSSVLPANSYSWSPEIAPANLIIELNEKLETYAKKNKIVYLDYYSLMVDDQKGLKKEYGRDSVHPSLNGYKVMEKAVQEAIERALSKKN